MPGAWTFDSDTMLSLRLDQAEQALRLGRLDVALIEVEELLDEHPQHARALQLVGEAAMSMGDVLTALEAYTRFVELHVPDAATLQALAIVRFEAVDFPGALDAAEKCTSLDPEIAAAWHYQGLAQERMDRAEEAKECFDKAHSLSPDQFATPKDLSMIAWDDLLADAIKGLPTRLSTFFEAVPVRWLDFPAVEDLLENYPPLSPFTDALYHGNPPTTGDPWTQRPDLVRLFRSNLVRPDASPEAITKRLTQALTHEALHWLGLSELPPESTQS